MDAVFKNHTIICNWNRRGPVIIDSLKSLGSRPILIVHTRPDEVIADIGSLDNVFVIPGDPSNHRVLMQADVPTAWSVIVLADYTLGLSADARSVQIALAVEKIQVSVHTVVELKDLRNKSHFQWTKVDELISDDDLGAKMIAQGVRHILAPGPAARGMADEGALIKLYQQLISPREEVAQLYRVSVRWADVRHLFFKEILETGLKKNILPLALCGYKRHEIAARPNQEAWTSWKTDVRPNPDPRKTLTELWPEWPGDDYLLGVIAFAVTREHAEQLFSANE